MPRKKPPRITIGMTSGTAALLPVLRIMVTLGLLSTGQSYLRARNHTSTIRQTMMVAAGTKPARNSATAEVLVTCAMTIMKIAGGGVVAPRCEQKKEDRGAHEHPHPGAGGNRRGRVPAFVASLGERRHQG